MNRYTVICIGSNVARKKDIVGQAIVGFSCLFKDFKASDIYESDDDSGLGAPYANAVCRGYYEGSLDELVAFSLQREKESGRTAQSKPSGVMPLDIDIVVFDGEIVNDTQFHKSYFRKGYLQLMSSDELCLCMRK